METLIHCKKLKQKKMRSKDVALNTVNMSLTKDSSTLVMICEF